jgi:hypothetical protein
MQLDGRHLYVNDILSTWLFTFEFNAFNHVNQFSFTTEGTYAWFEAAVWAMMQDYEQSFEFGAPLFFFWQHGAPLVGSWLGVSLVLGQNYGLQTRTVIK